MYSLGKRCGLGVYRSSIGLMYEGNFAMDVFEGHGVRKLCFCIMFSQLLKNIIITNNNSFHHFIS